MDDRTKTVAAISIIVGFFLLVCIVIGAVLTGKKVLSPVPEESAIKIIFLTPTPISIASPSMSIKATPSPSIRANPTSTVTPKTNP